MLVIIFYFSFRLRTFEGENVLGHRREGKKEAATWQNIPSRIIDKQLTELWFCLQHSVTSSNKRKTRRHHQLPKISPHQRNKYLHLHSPATTGESGGEVAKLRICASMTVEERKTCRFKHESESQGNLNHVRKYFESRSVSTGNF